MTRPVKLVAACAAFALLACQPLKPDSQAAAPDAGGAYRGETANTPLPSPEDVPADPEWEDDAGAWSIDRRCCQVVFRIDAQEPDDATGVVLAPMDGLRAGLPLTRGNGVWSAAACLPLNVTVPYRYAFSWRDADGGEDAGASRVSPFEVSVGDGQGGQTNLYRVQEDCGAADASVSLRP